MTSSQAHLDWMKMNEIDTFPAFKSMFHRFSWVLGDSFTPSPFTALHLPAFWRWSGCRRPRKSSSRLWSQHSCRTITAGHTESHQSHPSSYVTDGHHNHSQSFTIQHSPTLSNIRRKQTDESFSKSHQKAGGFPSLGLLCRWIQAQRRCARIGCPRNPCEVGRISWILCNKMVV